MITDILDVIDFEIECCDSLFSVREGSAHNELYIECTTLTSPFYNNLFTSNDLNEDIMAKTSKRLIANDKVPTFHVLKDSNNERVCLEKSMELYGSSAFMKCDMTNWNHSDIKTIEANIEVQNGQFSDQFMDVFEDGFVNNKGIGYALDPSWINAMNNAMPHEFLKETAFIAFINSQPVSICSTSIDENMKRAFLFNVATKNDFRKQGLSRAVVVSAIRDVKKRKVDEIYLTTAENSPMQSFYESLGFSVFGVTRMYTLST